MSYQKGNNGLYYKYRNNNRSNEVIIMELEFKDILIYWCKEKNMSKYRLAELTNISESHIRNLECGTKQPTYPLIKSIAQAFDLSLSEFFNVDIKDTTYLSDLEINLIDSFRHLPKETAAITAEYIEKLSKCK